MPFRALLRATGYFSFWCHNLQDGNSYVTDLTAGGYVKVNETALDGNMMNTKDILADTWVSVDDKGRAGGYVGKTVSRGEDVLVLADKALTDDEMLILYRALY